MSKHRILTGVSHAGRAVTVLLFCAGVQGQGGDAFLVVNDPRPVAEAVIQLMARHPVVITYEDPPYQYAGDLKDVTDEIRNPQAPARTDGRRTFVPVGGQLEVRYSVSSSSNKPTDLRGTLESIVQYKAALPAGGRFRVEQSGSVFHVIGSQVRDATGQWVEHRSVLDVPITLKSGDRSGYKTVLEILDEVTAKTGVKFAVSAMSVQKMLVGGSAIEAENEPAREVMLRTLQGMSDRLTWLLYYNSARQTYYFNIVAASVEPTIEIHGQPAVPARPGDPLPTGGPVERERN